ncbi:MAG: helix-turn-helix domain-containing protein [Saprospiraceae bacterium]|nr:helix-turn-helix domain-containing protein [Saprospiraceae bacterium]
MTIRKPRQDDYLLEVDQAIEAHLNDEKFRGCDLARLLCCCEMQLYRRLKKLALLSTANYIRRYRLRRSLELLRQASLSVGQVCYAVGFASLEYFSRSFKKEFGVCPNDYRLGKYVEIGQVKVR